MQIEHDNTEGQPVQTGEANPLPTKTGARNPDAVSGSASIPQNAWTTVLSFTPTTAKIILGFNADVGSLTGINFRVRLRVGGVVKIVEALASTQNGYMRGIQVRCPAGVAVDVQVIHNEVTAQTFEASINYQDE